MKIPYTYRYSLFFVLFYSQSQSQDLGNISDMFGGMDPFSVATNPNNPSANLNQSRTSMNDFFTKKGAKVNANAAPSDFEKGYNQNGENIDNMVNNIGDQIGGVMDRVFDRMEQMSDSSLQKNRELINQQVNQQNSATQVANPNVIPNQDEINKKAIEESYQQDNTYDDTQYYDASKFNHMPYDDDQTIEEFYQREMSEEQQIKEMRAAVDKMREEYESDQTKKHIEEKLQEKKLLEKRLQEYISDQQLQQLNDASLQQTYQVNNDNSLQQNQMSQQPVGQNAMSSQQQQDATMEDDKIDSMVHRPDLDYQDTLEPMVTIISFTLDNPQDYSLSAKKRLNVSDNHPNIRSDVNTTYNNSINRNNSYNHNAVASQPQSSMSGYANNNNNINTASTYNNNINRNNLYNQNAVASQPQSSMSGYANNNNNINTASTYNNSINRNNSYNHNSVASQPQSSMSGYANNNNNINTASTYNNNINRNNSYNHNAVASQPQSSISGYANNNNNNNNTASYNNNVVNNMPDAIVLDDSSSSTITNTISNKSNVLPANAENTNKSQGAISLEQKEVLTQSVIASDEVTEQANLDRREIRKEYLNNLLKRNKALIQSIQSPNQDQED